MTHSTSYMHTPVHSCCLFTDYVHMYYTQHSSPVLVVSTYTTGCYTVIPTYVHTHGVRQNSGYFLVKGGNEHTYIHTYIHTSGMLEHKYRVSLPS